MGTINNRRLTTGTNFRSGFPLFPSKTTINSPAEPVPIGIGGTSTGGGNLFSANGPVAWLRFSGTLSVRTIAGAFFGFQMGYNVRGETRNNGTASLNFSNEFASGGIGFGCGATVSVTVRVEESVLNFSFRNGWTTSWRNLFSITVSSTIDLIEVLFLLLSKLTQQKALEKLTEVREIAGSGAIWGLFSANTSRGLSSGSTLSFRPSLNFSVNILEFIPKVGAAIKKAKKAGLKIKAGPTLVVSFPVTISIVRLTTEDGNYNVSGSSNGTFNFNGGPVGTLGPTVSSVEITHSHTISLSYGLELRASLTFLKILKLSGVLVVPLVLEEVTNLQASLGPYFTALSDSNTVSSAELPEVVWG